MENEPRRAYPCNLGQQGHNEHDLAGCGICLFSQLFANNSKLNFYNLLSAYFHAIVIVIAAVIVFEKLENR